MAQTLKNLPAMLGTWVQSLGWEDSLEKGTATTPVFLPGKFHGQRRLVGYSPWDCKQSDTTEGLCTTQWILSNSQGIKEGLKTGEILN